MIHPEILPVEVRGSFLPCLSNKDIPLAVFYARQEHRSVDLAGYPGGKKR
jgi:hypothetical protein